jgi:hypothetical protein
MRRIMRNKKKHQAAFDKVADGLLRQGRRSMLKGSKTTCAYRGPDGERCGIGHIIPDHEYDPKMEKLDIFELLNGGWKIPSLRGLSDGFLADLQGAHDIGLVPRSAKPMDMAEAFEQWAESMRDTARNHGLKDDAVSPRRVAYWTRKHWPAVA